MPQFNKAVYDKMLNNINQDQQAKQLGDYFLIQKSRQLGKDSKLLSRMGVLTHGINNFSAGVVSFPISWWAAHIHLAALSGLFGTKQKQKANIRQVIFDTLMKSAFKYRLRSGKVVLTFFVHKVQKDPVGTLAHLGGRYAGGQLTNTVILRYVKSTGPKTVLWYANIGYAMYGSMLLSIAKGVRSLENLIWAGVSGQYDFPRKQVLDKIKNLEATDDEIEEALEVYMPALRHVYDLSGRKRFS